MKVLFVIRDHYANLSISPFIISQAESLEEKGIEISYFHVIGRGLAGYFNSVRKLKDYLKNHSTDLIHAHYSLCGWTSVIACSGTPIVLSLMGSDALGEYKTPGKISFRSKLVVLLTLLIQPFVDAIISKSENIHRKIYLKKKAVIIPNGIRMNHFAPSEQDKARKELGLNPKKKYILFLNNPEHHWKNFKLAREAVGLLYDEQIVLISPYPVEHSLVVKFINAANIVLMTSYMEGSSNVIKEAMACNCPIVTTNVGDAKWIIEDTQGCYITSFKPADVAEKIMLALAFSNKSGGTNGRARIQALGLDTETIAGKIIHLYDNVLKRNMPFL